MIFVSVGTEKFPFNRLLEGLDLSIKNGDIRDSIFAQTGHSKYKPSLFNYREKLTFEEMKESINKSQIVIMHAGIGSTILALSLGKIPILFPREAAYGEHLDNHQLEFAQKIRSIRKVLVAFTVEELVESIKNYQSLIADLNTSSNGPGRSNLISYLKQNFL